MVRISINHINKYGPLQFPARETQVFVEDSEVPQMEKMAFYESVVNKWLKAHEERQKLDWTKDIVGKDAIPNGSKIYTPTDEALGISKVMEEEL